MKVESRQHLGMSKFVIGFVCISVILTLGLVGVLVWNSMHEYFFHESVHAARIRFAELSAKILHLDEVLTMSARMAAATGDLRWEKRYRSFEPQLDAAIKETFSIGSKKFDVKTLVSKVDTANLKLVDMENMAFDLVRQQKGEQAQAVLDSNEYSIQKRTYSDGLNEIVTAIRTQSIKDSASHLRQERLSLILVIVVLPLLIIFWFVIFRLVARYRREHKHYEEELINHQETLEKQVCERTLELDKLNEALKKEVIEHKLAAQRNQQLAAIVESSEDAIISKDLSGIITSCNGSAERMYGYSKEEILGKHISMLVPAELKDEPQRIIERIVSGERIEHYETLRVRKDGLKFPVALSVSAVLDNQGKVVGMSAIASDITEAKQAANKLKESQEYLSAILNSMQSGVVVIDADSHVIVDANLAALRLFGAAKEKLVGLVCHNFICPAEKGRCPIADLGQAVDNSERVLINVNAERIPILKSVSRVVLGGRNLLIESFIDISERKLAEEKVLNSAKEWQHTFDSLSDFVFIMDLESRIIRANKVFIEAFGAGNPDNIVGKRCFEIVHKTGAHWPGCPLEVTLQDKKPCSKEVEDPGIGIPLLVTTSPMLDKNGNVMGVVHIAKDITDIKKAQAKIKEALELKSQFVSMASHELRTPLTAIKESIDIVSEGAASVLSEEMKDFLGVAKRNLDRLARLINNVLDFQKLESGRVEFNLQEHNINSVVTEVRDVMLSLAKDRGLELSVALDTSLAAIKFDKDKITQVLTNLINNAIKFTDKGSITVSTVNGKNSVLVSVSDTGKGISDEDLPKLFQKFQQLGALGERKTGGTGLGLAISKQIIEQHKGKIWAESKLGYGTLIIFMLPKREAREILSDIIEAVRLRLKEGMIFDLYMMRVDNYEELKKDIGQEQAEKIMDDILSLLENEVGNREFVSRMKENELIVFAEVARERLAELRKKMKTAVKEVVFDSSEKVKIEFSHADVVYPDDGKNVDALIEKCESSLISDRQLREKKRILIVDDDAAFVSVLRLMLGELGYHELMEAYDGSQVFTKLGEKSVDLMILDMEMPTMSGYEVIGKLKADVNTKALPILIISGYEVKAERLKEFFKREAIPMLSKPFEMRELERWLKYLL